MREKFRQWWEAATRLAEYMDYSPVTELHAEVSRLRLEVRKLAAQVDCESDVASADTDSFARSAGTSKP